jgi:hypothetical protein
VRRERTPTARAMSTGAVIFHTFGFGVTPRRRRAREGGPCGGQSFERSALEGGSSNAARGACRDRIQPILPGVVIGVERDAISGKL